LLVLASLFFVAGCGDASPSENGGDARFDASPPSATSNEEGGCGGDDASGGTAFSDLYRDFFGTTGAASCAGTPGGCHGDANSAGAGTWVCGSSVSSCYTGMTSAGLVSPSTKGDPTSTLLYSALRKQCGGGLNAMPQQPLFVFTPDDMDRITSWIAAGTPNN
jgi:hypothetical protein